MTDDTAKRIAAALEAIAGRLDELCTLAQLNGEAIANALDDLTTTRKEATT